MTGIVKYNLMQWYVLAWKQPNSDLYNKTNKKKPRKNPQEPLPEVDIHDSSYKNHL